jgi:hypothetical protein
MPRKLPAGELLTVDGADETDRKMKKIRAIRVIRG